MEKCQACEDKAKGVESSIFNFEHTCNKPMKDKDWESKLKEMIDGIADYNHNTANEAVLLVKSVIKYKQQEAIKSYKEELIKSLDYKISLVSGSSKSDMSCNIRAHCYDEIRELIKK